MEASRSISARIRLARLYVAKRRANPIVSASGLSTRPSRCKVSCGFPAPLGLLHRPPPHELDEPRFQAKVRLPQLAVVHIFDALPDLAHRRRCCMPARPQMPVVQPEHLRRQPRRHMHAVGDVADRNRIFRLARDTGRSTSRAKLRRAAPTPHWRAAKASAPARSCRILRADCDGFSRPRPMQTVRATAPAPRAADRDALP